VKKLVIEEPGELQAYLVPLPEDYFQIGVKWRGPNGLHGKTIVVPKLALTWLARLLNYHLTGKA
jgi:hypothetical protein